jgi:hypothetical protein
VLIYSGPVLLKDRSQFFGTQFHFTYSLYVTSLHHTWVGDWIHEGVRDSETRFRGKVKSPYF